MIQEASKAEIGEIFVAMAKSDRGMTWSGDSEQLGASKQKGSIMSIVTVAEFQIVLSNIWQAYRVLWLLASCSLQIPSSKEDVLIHKPF